jgi:hypothetical protein
MSKDQRIYHHCEVAIRKKRARAGDYPGRGTERSGIKYSKVCGGPDQACGPKGIQLHDFDKRKWKASMV